MFIINLNQNYFEVLVVVGKFYTMIFNDLIVLKEQKPFTLKFYKSNEIVSHYNKYRPVFIFFCT